ncbi:MAG: protoporphyrinogen oxidase HemJ [Gammaproteobacteria bacterium]|jgi:putative membrane protein|nr:protoporphyrinogen oxidase HemJ [Gammaproteobacteria bacterium]MBK9426438.1 protoporphyrinogen oxidase HemJ [Gammaproteobacteria bacterium]
MPAEWIEALHIISVVCWFAALFYLPRLFVYHAMAEDQISIERFKIMERKLSRGIATPAMLAALTFGIWLASLAPDYYLHQGWFLAKVTLVTLLVIYHHACLYLLRQFRNDRNTRSHVFYRWFNEIPVLFLIAIVILVVVRPF